MKANHRVDVVRVGPILPHPNADKLELTMVGGYQIVVGKGSFKEGDLAAYIPPDSVVPQTEPFKFIWQDHVGIDGIVPERRRRITVKRLRKEYSEGLLMPVSDLGFQIGTHGEMLGLYFNGKALEVGQDVSALIGVTHYIPEFDRASTSADTLASPKRRYPRTLKGWFFWTLHKLGLRSAGRSLALETAFNYPVYDVDALKNHMNWIQPGDKVQITEKIHGSNARYVYVDGVQYCGSREQWKKDGPNVWWNAFREYPEIGAWCKEHPGLVLYGEVGPTQKDKQDSRGWRYGAEEGKTFFFAFDVWVPEGAGVGPDAEPMTIPAHWDTPHKWGFTRNVPVLCVTDYLPGYVFSWAEGKSLVEGHKHHYREGIVVRKLDGSGITLKIVSNTFLEKDN
jgi:hypothetical protein